MKEYEIFMKENYIVCDQCGYNNEKNRFKNFGTCLRCGKILDDKTYFKVCLKKLTKRNTKARGQKGIKAIW